MLLVSILLVCASSIASAQTACLLYPSNSAPPSGYGASWDVTSPGKELLVKTNCPASGNDITITVGKGDTGQYIWSKTYVYNVAVTPPRWDMHTLTGTIDANGWVTSGAGTKSVTAPHAPTATNPLYIVGYVCTFHSAVWKCGCANVACTNKYWQLQGYKGTGGGTTGGTSGGSTGGTGGTTGAGASCPQKNDIFLNPFNKDSAHHRPIGSGAAYEAPTAPAMRSWLRASRFGINSGALPHGLYMIDAPADGPVMRVGIRPGTEGSGLPADVRFPEGGLRLDFPGNFDGNVAIYNRANGIFQHIRVYAWNDGSPHGAQYRAYDPEDLGHGTRPGNRIGTSASGVASPFGILRGAEVNAVGRPIQHALQMVMPRLASDRCIAMLGKTFVLPAVSMDNGWEGNDGDIPYGALFALPPEAKGGPDLDTLDLSEAGKRLAETIRDYGVYAVDGGGCNSGAIRADQNISAANFNALKADIPKFYRHMRRVTNSEWSMDNDPVGGGSPLAPNCAFDAP